MASPEKPNSFRCRTDDGAGGMFCVPSSVLPGRLLRVVILVVDPILRP